MSGPGIQDVRLTRVAILILERLPSGTAGDPVWGAWGLPQRGSQARRCLPHPCPTPGSGMGVGHGKGR